MEELSFLTFPTLETARLKLRAFASADANQILKLRSDADVLRFVEKEPMKDVAAARIWLADMVEKQEREEAIQWAICLKNDLECAVGGISLFHIRKAHFQAEVGYLLLPEQWGKGIATEALSAVLGFAWQVGFHRLEATTHPDNYPSAQVLDKVGFKLEGVLRQNWYFQGKFSDSEVWGLLNPNSRNT